SAWRARLACARAERGRVPGLDAVVRTGAGDADEQHRSRRRAAVTVERRDWRPQPSVGAVGTGPGADVAELRAVGRRGPVDPESASRSRRQSGLLDPERPDDWN